jgi:polyhydroxybutyrate depolymerase
MTSSGRVRQYRLHVPADYASKQPLPLVVNLHGYNSNAEQQEHVSQMSLKADAAGFVVVYPQGLGDPPSWRFGSKPEATADVTFIRDLLQHLRTRLQISPERIYVTGISNGAEMSYRLACDLSDMIAAVGLVAGGYPPFRDCQPTRPVPVVVFHGTADNLLPYDGRPPLFLPVREWVLSWAERNGCDSTPRVTYQKGEVTGETWGNCRQNADVVLYTIAGKGHSWPGSQMPASITTQDIVATDVMWQFFAAHPQP